MEPAFDYLVILDFEATCDARKRPNPQEIIEFPSVLFSTVTMSVVDEFCSFVRPHHFPMLTDFCVDLTSIRQSDVDSAPSFGDVFNDHYQWLSSHGLAIGERSSGASFAFVSCGDWDLGTMLPRQCRNSVPPVATIPWPYQRWINIEEPFAEESAPGTGPGMLSMLKALDLELEGRHHRGIDDCRNIARITASLMEAGVALQVTSEVSPSALPPVQITIEHRGAEMTCRLEKRTLESILARASGLFRRPMRWAGDETGEPLSEHRVRLLGAGERVRVFSE